MDKDVSPFDNVYKYVERPWYNSQYYTFKYRSNLRNVPFKEFCTYDIGILVSKYLFKS